MECKRLHKGPYCGSKNVKMTKRSTEINVSVGSSHCCDKLIQLKNSVYSDLFGNEFSVARQLQQIFPDEDFGMLLDLVRSVITREPPLDMADLVPLCVQHVITQQERRSSKNTHRRDEVMPLNPMQQHILPHLHSIFPNISKSVIEASVRHHSNLWEPLTEDVLLQRCIDDLLDGRTAGEATTVTVGETIGVASRETIGITSRETTGTCVNETTHRIQETTEVVEDDFKSDPSDMQVTGVNDEVQEISGDDESMDVMITGADSPASVVVTGTQQLHDLVNLTDLDDEMQAEEDPISVPGDCPNTKHTETCMDHEIDKSCSLINISDTKSQSESSQEDFCSSLKSPTSVNHKHTSSSNSLVIESSASGGKISLTIDLPVLSVSNKNNHAALKQPTHSKVDKNHNNVTSHLESQCSNSLTMSNSSDSISLLSKHLTDRTKNIAGCKRAACGRAKSETASNPSRLSNAGATMDASDIASTHSVSASSEEGTATSTASGKCVLPGKETGHWATDTFNDSFVNSAMEAFPGRGASVFRLSPSLSLSSSCFFSNSSCSISDDVDDSSKTGAVKVLKPSLADADTLPEIKFCHRIRDTGVDRLSAASSSNSPSFSSCYSKPNVQSVCGEAACTTARKSHNTDSTAPISKCKIYHEKKSKDKHTMTSSSVCGGSGKVKQSATSSISLSLPNNLHSPGSRSTGTGVQADKSRDPELQMNLLTDARKYPQLQTGVLTGAIKSPDLQIGVLAGARKDHVQIGARKISKLETAQQTGAMKAASVKMNPEVGGHLREVDVSLVSNRLQPKGLAKNDKSAQIVTGTMSSLVKRPDDRQPEPRTDDRQPKPRPHDPQSVARDPVVPKNIRTMEDQLNEMKTKVLDLFPDVEPAYLDGLCRTHLGQFAVNNICNVLLEVQYPKRITTTEQTETTTQPSQPVSIDYFKDYKSVQVPNESYIQYRTQSIDYLCAEFKWVPYKIITDIFFRCEHYAPAYQIVNSIWEEAKKVKGSSKMVSFSGLKFTTTVCVNCFTASGTRIKAVRLLKNRRQCGKKSSCFHPELERQIRFVEQRSAETAANADHEVAVQLNEQEYEEEGQCIECGCCYGEFPFDNMVQCYDGHLFCENCLRQYTQESVVGHGKVNLTCMTDACDSTFPKSQLEKALPSEILARYEDRVTAENLNLADIEGDLVRCPHCEFAAFMDPDDKVFRCQNDKCAKETCRYCKEDWGEHFGKKCEEIEKKDETKLRLQFEEKMTKAKVRECHRCKAQFMKETGCNKMICRCGAKMCYICRKPNIDYNHFCQHVREPGKNCDKCSRCSLWTNADEDDDRAVDELQKEAGETRRNQGYTDDKLIGAPKSPQAKKSKRVAPEVAGVAQH